MGKNKLAIFDLDGTLFDTLETNYRAYQKALSEYGRDISFSDFQRKCFGKNYKTFLKSLFPDVFSDEAIENIHMRKQKAYADCLRYTKENYQLFNILCLIKSEYYIALATTASRVNCEMLLRAFHKEHYFDLIVTQEDVSKVKPSPEAFSLAMRKLDIAAANTIIFEDSADGLEAAMQTGATVFAVEYF